jgi:hypothetical protein
MRARRNVAAQVGRSAIHQAAMSAAGTASVVMTLVGHKADIDQQDDVSPD